ncbi:MAG: tetratricopeptide repeat protein [Spirochaetes bacterium]|nr:tetratricopeptide repeat protein [Spirochaetota bacterium]
MHGKDIEIKRNVIERFLMVVRDFVLKFKKEVLISLIAVVSAAALLVAGIIFYEKKTEWDLADFEQALKKYNDLKIEDKEAKKKELEKTVKSLNEVIDSSYWGYINNNGYYIIAGLFASMDMNDEAKSYMLKFADKSPGSFFAPIALNRAAIICEQMEKQDEAFAIFQKLEKDYEDCIIIDEIYYNLGRIYQIKGEKVKAREYYNKIISSYPRSIFAEKARKRLLILGYTRDDIPKNI